MKLSQPAIPVDRLKLTREERKAVFDGTLRVLRRPTKPDLEAGARIVVSWTRGGKQVLDRKTGETIEYPRQPRLWITIKGWHLKAGSREWETAVTIHDQRQQHRALAYGGLGGIPREPGLKTRWGTKVIHRNGEIAVESKRVLTKEEQHENWTPETERGYGGPNGMERSIEGDLVPATGVDDAVLADFARIAEEQNIARRDKQRDSMRKMREEMRFAENMKKRNRPGASAAKRRADRAKRRLSVPA